MSESDPFFPHGMPTLPGHDPTKVRRAPIVPSAAGMRATANENNPDLVPADVEISDAKDFRGTDGSTASVCHFPGGVIISGFTYGNEPVDVHLDPAVARKFAAAIVRDADAADGGPSPNPTPWPPADRPPMREWHRNMLIEEIVRLRGRCADLGCEIDILREKCRAPSADDCSEGKEVFEHVG